MRPPYTPPPRTDPNARQTCVYCGKVLTPAQAHTWPGTCNLHADLPEHDPNFMLSLRGGRR